MSAYNNQNCTVRSSMSGGVPRRIGRACRPLLVLTFLTLLARPALAQEPTQGSVRDLAPRYGIRTEFLDDTLNLIQYLNDLKSKLSGTGEDNHILTDSCVALNARLATFNLALQHDYRRRGDTLWISPTVYATDLRQYAARITRLSSIALRSAYSFIQRESAIKDSISQSALQLRLDTIRRNHNLIISTCDGIGVRDKVRQKELKDIYYAYLSVYNRYDFSRKSAGTDSVDERHMQTLLDFQGFQEDLINDLLSVDNIPAQISNFVNTLRTRCGRAHLDVLRSYQRVFQRAARPDGQTTEPVEFSTVYEYYNYIDRLLDTRNWQQAYLTAIDLREQMDSNSRRIIDLYSKRYRKAADTYRDVEATINAIPSFTNSTDANTFLTNLDNFVNIIQQNYIDDYARVDAIASHGDSIIRACAMRYNDVAKSYRHLSDLYITIPTYRTIDEVYRHGESLRTFQMLQRQFDTILELRRSIDGARDSIADGWASHLTIYNGYQNIRKQFDIVPSFINTYGGSIYIQRLREHRAIQSHCIQAINHYLIFQGLETQINSLINPYRNFRKAYSVLKDNYLSRRTIITTQDMLQYEQQYIDFAVIQQALIKTLRGSDVAATDLRLKGITDISRIELIIGISR